MKTVSKILTIFEKQLAQLELIEIECGLSIEKRKGDIIDLETKNDVDSKEANHAKRVAKKIQEIIQ